MFKGSKSHTSHAVARLSRSCTPLTQLHTSHAAANLSRLSRSCTPLTPLTQVHTSHAAANLSHSCTSLTQLRTSHEAAHISFLLLLFAISLTMAIYWPKHVAGYFPYLRVVFGLCTLHFCLYCKQNGGRGG
jgi:hypothetical protein